MRAFLLGLAAFGIVVSPATLFAQEAAPGTPANTNPLEKAVFPAGDQTPDQQSTDQLACYQWATEQDSWDPEADEAAIHEAHEAALAEAGRRRRQKRLANAEYDDAMKKHEAHLESWGKYWVACMKGKEYSVE